jgi:hypothetical protein
MQKYIKPVRAMLGKYKQSLNNIRDNQRMLTRSTTDMSQNDENICPNSTNSSVSGTRKK